MHPLTEGVEQLKLKDWNKSRVSFSKDLISWSEPTDLLRTKDSIEIVKLLKNKNLYYLYFLSNNHSEERSLYYLIGTKEGKWGKPVRVSIPYDPVIDEIALIQHLQAKFFLSFCSENIVVISALYSVLNLLILKISLLLKRYFHSKMRQSYSLLLLQDWN